MSCVECTALISKGCKHGKCCHCQKKLHLSCIRSSVQAVVKYDDNTLSKLDVYCTNCRISILASIDMEAVNDYSTTLDEINEHGFSHIKGFFSEAEVKLLLDDFWLHMSIYGVDPNKLDTIKSHWPKDADGNNDGDVDGGYGFLKVLWNTSSQW